MQASGVVFRPLPCGHGAGIDTHSHYSSPKASFSGELRPLGPPRDFLLRSRRRLSLLRPRMNNNSNIAGFHGNSHLLYYCGSGSGFTSTTMIRCGGGKKEKDEHEGKDTVTKTKKKMMKRRLKLLKGLSRDLSTLSEMGFGVDAPPPRHALVDEVKGKLMSEAAEILLQQLEQLRIEEKESKRKSKEEKAKLKATQMQNRLDCEVSSGSSSSDSSDSECEELAEMSSLKTGALTQQMPNELEPANQETILTFPGTLTQQGNTTELQPVKEEAISVLPSTDTQEWKMAKEMGLEVHRLPSPEHGCCAGTSSSCSNLGSIGCSQRNSLVTSEKKIQVCMGGKCKKSGAAALLEEFQRVVSVEGVSGCKCMGKCRDGPNVRVLNCFDGVQTEVADDSVQNPTNPLCIGVGLEDVGLIVANFFGETHKDLGFATAS